jgi:hypothetical protein
MSNPSISVEIGARVLGNFRTSINEALSSLDSVSERAKVAGKALSLGVSLPLLALGVAAIKSGSDAEEASSKFNTVFKSIQKTANDAADDLSKSFGLSANASKELLGDTGDLLTGFGFTQESALSLSKQVNELAVDLASFTNFSGGAEGASSALTKALLGERDSVKALGISILEEDVKKQVAINTAKGFTFATERQAKAQATLDIAIEQSTNAIGDYSRTSDGFANQQRRLGAVLEDIAASIGAILLPIATELTSVVRALAERFSNLSPEAKKSIVIFAGIAIAIGPLLLALGSITTILPIIGAGFIALTGPIGIALSAISIVIIAIVSDLEGFQRQLKLALLEVINFATKTARAIDFLAGAFPQFKAISQVALIALEQTAKDVAKSFLDSFAVKSVKAVEDLTNTIGTDIPEAAQTFEEFSKIADAANKKIFQDGQDYVDNYNASLAETKRLQDTIVSVSKNIANQGPKKILQEFGRSENGGTKMELGLSTDALMTNLSQITMPEIDTSKFNESVSLTDQKIIEANSKFVSSAEQLGIDVSKVLESSLEMGLGDFAFSIGEALGNGANVLEAGGKALLGALGGVLNQLGQMAIGVGITIKAIKTALKTLNPVVAVAAGVALIALAGFVSSKAKSIGAGGSGSSGVGAGGSGGSFTGSGSNSFDPFRSFKIEVVGEITGEAIGFALAQGQNRKN